MDWNNFWSVIWFVFWIFAYAAYLFALFAILADLFRDREAERLVEGPVGHLPDLRAVPHGAGVPDRPGPWHGGATGQPVTPRSGRTTRANRAGSFANPAHEIEKAKNLLDQGVITQGEFDAIKNKALGNKF